MEIPRLGLGCAQLGNLFQARSEDDCHAILATAWEAGVRHFDTAPHYGLGLSEKRLGRFLATKPRDEFILSTKVGRVLTADPDWDGQSLDRDGFAVAARYARQLDYSLDGIYRSTEASLDRMGLDAVDILYVHDPERSPDPGATESGVEALVHLREQGVVGSIGVGSMSPNALLRAVKTEAIDLLMVAGRYTLLDQSVSPEILEACDQIGTRIVAAAIYNSGVLASTEASTAKYNYVDAPQPVLEHTNAIARMCGSHGVELATAAIHYPLLDHRVASVVVGADNPHQVRQNVLRLAAPPPQELWADLATHGLVPRCA